MSTHTSTDLKTVSNQLWNDLHNRLIWPTVYARQLYRNTFGPMTATHLQLRADYIRTLFRALDWLTEKDTEGQLRFASVYDVTQKAIGIVERIDALYVFEPHIESMSRIVDIDAILYQDKPSPCWITDIELENLFDLLLQFCEIVEERLAVKFKRRFPRTMIIGETYDSLVSRARQYEKIVQTIENERQPLVVGYNPTGIHWRPLPEGATLLHTAGTNIRTMNITWPKWMQGWFK